MLWLFGPFFGSVVVVVVVVVPGAGIGGWGLWVVMAFEVVVCGHRPETVTCFFFFCT